MKRKEVLTGTFESSRKIMRQEPNEIKVKFKLVKHLLKRLRKWPLLSYGVIGKVVSTSITNKLGRLPSWSRHLFEAQAMRVRFSPSPRGPELTGYPHLRYGSQSVKLMKWGFYGSLV